MNWFVEGADDRRATESDDGGKEGRLEGAHATDQGGGSIRHWTEGMRGGRTSSLPCRVIIRSSRDRKGRGGGVGLRRDGVKIGHSIDTSPPLAALYDSYMYRWSMAKPLTSTSNVSR